MTTANYNQRGNTMEISSPLCITSRLLPGCRIRGADISIEYSHKLRNGRQVYCWYIDNADPKENYHSYDLESGVGGGSLQEGLESLLDYLRVFAVAKTFEKRMGDGTETENGNLFPAGLAEWAVENADAIVAMRIELQEHPDKLIVE